MSVDVTIDRQVMVVTINRPEARNALNGAVGAGIAEALAEAERAADHDGSVGAVILTGAGDQVFSAGMDLKAFAAGEDISPVGRGLAALRHTPLPLIAAVNGSALAGGFEAMLSCDLVVAAEHARFGIPEVKRGLVAGGGGTSLPRRIPLAIALEIGLTGSSFGAGRALQLGLVNRVVPAAEVMPTARSLAAEICANGPMAVRVTKQLMREELGPDRQRRIWELAGPVMASEDAREGAVAFAERRQPVWRNR